MGNLKEVDDQVNQSDQVQVTFSINVSDIDTIVIQNIPKLLKQINSIRTGTTKAAFLRNGLAACRVISTVVDSDNIATPEGIIDSLFFDIEEMSDLLI